MCQTSKWFHQTTKWVELDKVFGCDLTERLGLAQTFPYFKFNSLFGRLMKSFTSCWFVVTTIGSLSIYSMQTHCESLLTWWTYEYHSDEIKGIDTQSWPQRKISTIHCQKETIVLLANRSIRICIARFSCIFWCDGTNLMFLV